MLLNIDKPQRSAFLHSEGCTRVPSPLGSDYKPVGHVGRDGGWFEVSSPEEAEVVVAREFPGTELQECSTCRG